MVTKVNVVLGSLCFFWHLPPLVAQTVKKFCLQCRSPEFDPWVAKIFWRREWPPTPVSLPGESHGQKSLTGYSSWNHNGVTNTHTHLPWKGLLRWLSGKESTCLSRRLGFDPQVRNIPWRRKWQPILVFLPGKSHEQRGLADFSSWGSKRVGHDLTTKTNKENNCFLNPLSTNG